MVEAEPVYVVQIREARSGRVIFNSLFEGKLMPLLQEDGEIGAQVIAADRRKYWRARKSGERKAAHA